MHNINHTVYSIKISKEVITNEIDNYIRQETWREGGNGLDRPIRFIDRVMSDYDSAEHFLKENDKGWYDCLAVKFKDKPRNKTTKKLDDLKQKRKETFLEYDKLNRKVAALDFKAEFIGCKHCNSKINKTYIKSNRCPICNEDMRSETTLKKLENMKEKINKIDNDIKAEERKLAEKYGEIKWLVKYEYHT